MRTFRIFLLLLLGSCLSDSSASASGERFWVSFSSGHSGKYLMQIDPLGNVVLAPKRIMEGPRTHPTNVTALSHHGNQALDYWFTLDSPSGGDGRVVRIVVDKKTLRTIRIVETGLAVESGFFTHLTVSHREGNNLLSFPRETPEGPRVVVYPVDPFGRLEGLRWFLSPPLLYPSCENYDCKGGTLSNGRLGYWVVSNPQNIRQASLFVQPLGHGGHPAAAAVRVANYLGSTARGYFTITGVDATGPLPDNVRFLVFIKQPSPGGGTAKLELVQIDAAGGAPLTAPVLIHREEERFGGNVKIDPRGRFVIFVKYALGLYYQALDGTGRPSGSPKNLVGQSMFTAIDLLKESNQTP